jgi:hypothetical protein
VFHGDLTAQKREQPLRAPKSGKQGKQWAKQERQGAEERVCVCVCVVCARAHVMKGDAECLTP